LEQNTQYIEEDKIDLRELFSVLKKRRKLIWITSAIFTLLALTYVLVSTPWWQANTTIEIGNYVDTKTGKTIYLENGVSVAKRLNVKYIDIYQYVKDRNSTIESISVSKKNVHYIGIIALAKNNHLAINEISLLIDKLQDKHHKIIDEIIANKQSLLNGIDRSIYQIEKYTMKNIIEKINYIQTIELSAIEQKIFTIAKDIKSLTKQRENAFKNLSSLQNEASLTALRLAQIQNLEYQISENTLKIIDLEQLKQKKVSTILPELQREVEQLKTIKLETLKAKRKLITLSMQTHNYHNTEVVGKIITQEKPIKPKKALIVIVAFITGLMFSVFLVFFLEFLQGVKKEEDA